MGQPSLLHDCAFTLASASQSASAWMVPDMSTHLASRYCTPLPQLTEHWNTTVAFAQRFAIFSQCLCNKQRHLVLFIRTVLVPSFSFAVVTRLAPTSLHSVYAQCVERQSPRQGTRSSGRGPTAAQCLSSTYSVPLCDRLMHLMRRTM